MPQGPTKQVFISYSQDSLDHEERVLALAERLREDGMDCMIDQYVMMPEDGWRLWTERQIRDSDFVLLVCTETYRRRFMDEEEPGRVRVRFAASLVSDTFPVPRSYVTSLSLRSASRGLMVRLEGRLIREALYRDGGSNRKFVPVLFEASDPSHIPYPVGDTNSYPVETERGYEDLYRRLTDQPRIIPPAKGPRSGRLVYPSCVPSSQLRY